MSIIVYGESKQKLLPTCTHHLDVPAIVFSLGGFAYQPYHAIADIIVPLYFTSHHFNGSVVFLILDYNSSWISRFKLVFERLSNYDTVDLGHDNRILCFSRIITGLDADIRELGAGLQHFTNSSIIDFERFIRYTYSLERHSVINKRTPRLLIISREKSRRLLNRDEIVEACKRIGFEVDTREIEGEVAYIAGYINSFDVIVGVHAAGFANMIFLPESAVVVQIVPFGLDTPSQVFYQNPTGDMNLRYLEYKIDWEESSLANKYSRDDRVYKEPSEVRKQGWKYFKSIYFDGQDVTVDVSKFENVLEQAYKLINN